MKKFIFLLGMIGLSFSGFGQVVHDLAVTQLMSPVSSGSLTASEMVTVVIRNYGNVPESNFFLHYQVNNGPPIVETVAATLSPGQTLVFTFATLINASAAGCYHLEVCTAVPADNNTTNDCLFQNLMHFPPFVVCDTIYPQFYWTGSTNGIVFTEDDTIRISGGQASVGWATFDMAAVPAGVSIQMATLRLYTTTPYNQAGVRFHKVTVNPTTTGPAPLYNHILAGQEYMTGYGGTAGQSLYFSLPAAANQDLSDAVFLGRFTVGLSETSADPSHIGSFRGWNQGFHMPYIILYYSPPLPHDVAVISSNLGSNMVPGPFIPTVGVQNMGTNTETFSVTLEGSGGYAATQTVTALPPGSSQVVTFSSWNVPAGQVCLTASTMLATDANCLNDWLRKCAQAIPPPATLTGMITYDNLANSPLVDSTQVWLFSLNVPGFSLVDTVDASGQYFFANVPPGDYIIMVQSQKQWGGGGSNDALAVLRHYVGQQLLTGLRLRAADVSANGVINSLDALYIVQRFAGLIAAFPAGDWIFDQPQISVSSSTNIQMNIKGLCMGDVNGSWVP